MKILLLNPPYFSLSKNYPFVPLGLAYIGACLEKAGCEVDLVDGALGPIVSKDDGWWHGKSMNEVEALVQSSNPGVVGIGCFFSQRFPYALETARRVKACNPGTITVVGGIHPTLLPAEVLRNPEIDFVIIGEGEESFLKLIQMLGNGEKNFEAIDGCAFREDGRIVINPKKHYIEDLDMLPIPALHKLPVEDYFKYTRLKRWGAVGRCFSVISSRSCPNRCHFCSMYMVHGPKWRARSPENVVDEMEHLVQEYRAGTISFEDDNLTFSKPRMLALCETIRKRGLKVNWVTPNGVSIKTLDEDVLTAMRDTGCIEVNLAIESGDDYLRNKRMKKKLPIEDVVDVATICRKIRLRANACFIVGYPGENRNTIRRTIELVHRLSFANIAVSYATPFPGTGLYEECVENGYVEDGFLQRAFNEGTLRLFTEPCIATREFSLKSVTKWRSGILMHFYAWQFFRLFSGDGNAWYNFMRVVKSLLGMRHRSPKIKHLRKIHCL